LKNGRQVSAHKFKEQETKSTRKESTNKMTKKQNDKDSPPSPPVPDKATWKLLLDAYIKVKDGTDEENDAALVQAMASPNPSGFHIAYEVRQTPHKGRGLFTTEFVPKGACISDSRLGYFTTERQFRNFLDLLPPDLAHQCIDWAGVDDYRGGEAVCTVFSDSAFMNHGSSKAIPPWEKLRAWVFPRSKQHQPKPRANMRSKWYDGMWHMVARRDIQAGEELLCDYSEIGNYDHSLEWFTKIYDEHYPGTPHHDELERWSK
jgi:hypothetical protein